VSLLIPLSPLSTLLSSSRLSPLPPSSLLSPLLSSLLSPPSSLLSPLSSLLSPLLSSLLSPLSSLLFYPLSLSNPSRQWLAPEVLDSINPQYNCQSDVFSFGIVFLEVFKRQLPYTEYEQYIIKQTYSLTDEEMEDQDLIEAYEQDGWLINKPGKVRFARMEDLI
jgi:serine/threonine protein kinase